VDLEGLNAAGPAEARAMLLACCASSAWANALVAARPFADTTGLLDTAFETWWSLGPADWDEAFAAHPRIGERVAGHDTFAESSRREQAGAADAPDEVLAALEACNREYEARFGRVFLVFASGRTAGELLDLCRARLGNDDSAELRIAAAEQAKITDLRLRRLLGIG
jgi:OHCU decarboxylase